jgi:hypothetical protein
VDYHENLLLTDLALFNRKLADWLVVSDAERPHHSPGQQCPRSLPTGTSTRVPKVLDSYRGLQIQMRTVSITGNVAHGDIAPCDALRPV